MYRTWSTMEGNWSSIWWRTVELCLYVNWSVLLWAIPCAVPQTFSIFIAYARISVAKWKFTQTPVADGTFLWTFFDDVLFYALTTEIRWDVCASFSMKYWMFEREGISSIILRGSYIYANSQRKSCNEKKNLLSMYNLLHFPIRRNEMKSRS